MLDVMRDPLLAVLGGALGGVAVAVVVWRASWRRNPDGFGG